MRQMHRKLLAKAATDAFLIGMARQMHRKMAVAAATDAFLI